MNTTVRFKMMDREFEWSGSDRSLILREGKAPQELIEFVRGVIADIAATKVPAVEAVEIAAKRLSQRLRSLSVVTEGRAGRATGDPDATDSP